MTVLASIDKKDNRIKTGVLEVDPSIILSKASVKRTQTEIDFKKYRVKMLGQIHDYSPITSGHFYLSSNEKKQILEDITRKSVQHLSERKWKTEHELHNRLTWLKEQVREIRERS